MQKSTAFILRQLPLSGHHSRTLYPSLFSVPSLFSSTQITLFNNGAAGDRFQQQQCKRFKNSNASPNNVTNTRRWGAKKRTSVPHKSPQPSSGISSGKKLNNPSSKAWLLRQSKDEYARRARKEGSPSRAIYKLEQIDDMHRRKQQNRKKGGASKSSKQLFQKGDVVVDLGAAPGGWSMYASSKIKSNGMVIAVDLLPLDERTLHQNSTSSSPIHVIQGDFRFTQVKGDIFNAIMKHREQQKMVSTSDVPHVDVVMSDMAANFTGDKTTDALKTMSLCEEALAFAVGLSTEHHGVLRTGGTFLCKFFSCGRENERDLMDAVKGCFARADVLKPPASRKASAEQYLLATGYLGPP